MNIYDAAAPIPGTVVDKIAWVSYEKLDKSSEKAIEDNGGLVDNR